MSSNQDGTPDRALTWGSQAQANVKEIRDLIFALLQAASAGEDDVVLFKYITALFQATGVGEDYEEEFFRLITTLLQAAGIREDDDPWLASMLFLTMLKDELKEK